MKKQSKCHPKRFELFSVKTARPWERGLCAACHAKASKTRVAVRDRIVQRLEGGPNRVPRTATRFIATAGVSLRDWLGLVQTVAGACVYCRRPSEKLAINYLVPLKRGGKDHVDNALPACPRCIHCKGRRLITEWPEARALMSPAVFDVLEKRTLRMLPDQKLNLTQELNSATLGADGTGNEKDQRETGAASGAR